MPPGMTFAGHDFNPTLVQFKQYTSVIALALLEDFNPTLVQFKHDAHARTLTIRINFNPTLVQFKQFDARPELLNCRKFQSYISPIQTRSRVRRGRGIYQISILH